MIRRTRTQKRVSRTTKPTRTTRTAKTVPKRGNVGQVYRGRTKYIDVDTKPERNFVVVRENNKGVEVAKLKSIKKFDSSGRNADKALVEINHSRYGLQKRTGVDFQRFGKNRMSGGPLKLSDTKVFPEGQARFKLGSHDTHNALEHTGVKNKKRRGN